MILKISYITIILFFACFCIAFIIFKLNLLFFIYGYKQNLINSESTESYIAFQKIAYASKIFLALTILISIITTIISYYFIKQHPEIYPGFNYIIFFVSLFTSAILLIGLVLYSIIPTRII